MKTIACISLLALLVGGLEASTPPKCYDTMTCGNLKYEEPSCASQWGAFPRVQGEAYDLLKLRLSTSLEYLMLSSNFKEWKANRPGLANYFSKLSDDTWNEALGLLTHIAERGGSLADRAGSIETDFIIGGRRESYELKEIESLVLALDTEKEIATKTNHVASLSTHGHKPDSAKTRVMVAHDFEFAHFLAEGLHHNSVLRIKHLANNVKLLQNIIMEYNTTTTDLSYPLFKFDSVYLK